MTSTFKIIIISVALMEGVSAMALADVGKVCLFSGMSGVIKIDGKPAADARLVRTVNKEKDRTDETITDESGYFEFKPVFERMITNICRWNLQSVR